MEKAAACGMHAAVHAVSVPSRIKMSGLRMRARASAMRCFCPPLSSLHVAWSAWSVRTPQD
eukprot:355021-Chlamydomonas_euryale.AAC.8